MTSTRRSRSIPSDADAYIGRGDTWLATSQGESAIADYTEAIRLDPRTRMGTHSRAFAYSGEHQYDKAIPDYDEAIRLNPIATEYYFERGVAFHETKDYDKAIADFTVSSSETARFGSFGEAGRRRGNRRRNTARRSRTSAQRYGFARETRIFSSSAATAYDSNGELDKAIADCTEAIRTRRKACGRLPSFEESAGPRKEPSTTRSPTKPRRSGLMPSSLVPTCRAVSPGTTSEIMQRPLLISPKRSGSIPATSTPIAAVRLHGVQRKEYQKAIADYTEAIRLDPGDAETYRDRGYTWGELKDYQKAIADYTEAIRLDPKNPRAFFNRGWNWDELKNYDKAIADYDEAIRLEPTDASAYANRGLLGRGKTKTRRRSPITRRRSGSTPRTRGLFQPGEDPGADWRTTTRRSLITTKRFGSSPMMRRAYINRGCVWSRKKDTTRQSPITPRRSGSTHAMRAHCYRGRRAWSRLGNFDKALADFNETIRLDPRHASAYNSRAWLWATCPDGKCRDGKKAVESATKACELTEWKNAYQSTPSPRPMPRPAISRPP